jgi:hydrogenase 3 maturation protease
MNFEELIRMLSLVPEQKIVFVGLGNEIRGDDGAGLEFINQLRQQKIIPDKQLIKCYTTPENYLSNIIKQNPRIVIFIDTARMQKPPGTIQEIPAESIDAKGYSTHTYSMKLIADYLRANGVREIRYLGIEPKSTTMGNAISAEIINGIRSFFN